MRRVALLVTTLCQVTWSLPGPAQTLGGDLVLVKSDGEMSELYKTAISMMEDRVMKVLITKMSLKVFFLIFDDISGRLQ